MKKLILTLFTLFCLIQAKSQQCFTLSKSCSYENDPIGLLAVGNLNTENLGKANSSGKLQAYVRFWQKYGQTKSANKGDKNVTLYFSIAKNVTRNDTLSLKSLLYPDLGNIAYQGTLEYSVLKWQSENKELGHYFVPFAEVWIKDFKIGNSDKEIKYFTTLNNSFGMRYTMHYSKKKEDEENNTFFSIATYISNNHILNKDREDFISLTEKQVGGIMPLTYRSFGVKVALEYNKFQFYVDTRYTGDQKSIPSRELKGLTFNIGFITNLNIAGED